MSPTTSFSLAAVPADVRGVGWPGGGVYPGWGYGWVGSEGYTGTPPDPSQDPNIRHILGPRPYPRPNEGNSGHSYEVSQIRV